MIKKVKNPDFQKSKIYKITCNETGLLYIGATTLPLSYRLQHHISPYNPCASKRMTNPEIELLFNFPCTCKEKLNEKEAEVIKAHKLLLKERCINVKMPGRTMQQYLIENADEIREKRRNYYAENSEAFKQRARDFYVNKRAYPMKIKRLQNQISKEILKENPRENWLLKWNKRLIALRNGQNDKEITLTSS